MAAWDKRQAIEMASPTRPPQVLHCLAGLAAYVECPSDTRGRRVSVVRRRFLSLRPLLWSPATGHWLPADMS